MNSLKIVRRVLKGHLYTTQLNYSGSNPKISSDKLIAEYVSVGRKFGNTKAWSRLVTKSLVSIREIW